MNCRIENYNALIARKMSGWNELANCGVDKFERARGRRNLRRLTGNHPEIAVDCEIGQPRSGMSGRTELQIPGLGG